MNATKMRSPFGSVPAAICRCSVPECSESGRITSAPKFSACSFSGIGQPVLAAMLDSALIPVETAELHSLDDVNL